MILSDSLARLRYEVGRLHYRFTYKRCACVDQAGKQCTRPVSRGVSGPRGRFCTFCWIDCDAPKRWRVEQTEQRELAEAIRMQREMLTVPRAVLYWALALAGLNIAAITLVLRAVL